MTVGRRRGTEHTETVSNTKALTDKQYQAAKDYMVALEWRFPEISRQQLQVEDRKEELCDKTKQRIEEACLCMNSTAKQAEKQLPLALKNTSTAGAKAATELKAALKNLYKHITVVNEIQQGIQDPFKNSSGLREDLMEAAKATVEAQDAVKVSKALG